ncbi:ParA family protein [Anaerotignum sp.]|uniref:ParA family protein n=1 Tax=Anaerotignum sp. TaxID=2039241 RepID=UPI0028ADD9B7|nr:AAA family ATPase [Anaerotignum sp.]
MKTIAIVNQKGGVGKTVTAVNLAIGLAQEGKKVIAIDLDAQGSLTVSLGYNEQDKMETTVSTILEKIIEDEPISHNEGILHHEEGIDLIPANIELSGLEVTLVNTMSRESVLREYLKVISNDYDVAVIDCSPSLGMLTINALTCADEVIIPVQAQYLSIKGMEQLFRTIGRVRKLLNPNLQIGGILVTMADMRTNYTKDIIALLHDTYGGKIKIFDSVIPLSVRAAEMSAEGKSIYLHDPNGKVSSAYKGLIKEVV